MAEILQEQPSLKAQSAWLMLAKTVGFVFSFALPLLVVRFLDQDDVGTYRQAFQFITNAAVILPLSFGMSAYYFLSAEPEKKASAVLNVLVVNAAVGIAAWAALAAMPWLVGGVFSNGGLVPLAPLIGAVLFLWMISSFLEVVAVANQEPRAATAFIVLAQFTKMLFMVSAVLVFASVEAFLLAAAAQGILQTVALIAYLHSRFPRFWTAFDARFLMKQAKYAVPLGLVGLLWTVQTDIHFYFVGMQFSTAEFAVYAYGCFQLPLVWMLADSINSVLIPRMSRLAQEGDRTEIVRLLGRSTHKLALVYFPLSAYLTVMADLFIGTLFTESYSAAVPVFLINLTLLPFHSFSLDAVTRAFQDLGRKLLALRLCLSVVLVGLLYLEGRSLGLSGIAMTVVGVLAFERVVMMTMTARRLGFSSRELGHFMPVGKTALAALAAAGTLYLFQVAAGQQVSDAARAAVPMFAGDMGPVWSGFLSGAFSLAVAGAVFAAVYAVGVLGFGLLDEEELAVLRKLVPSPDASSGPKEKEQEAAV